MPNLSIQTVPSGRSPDKKYYFGERTKFLDLTRPKYNKVGKLEDYNIFLEKLEEQHYQHKLVFYTSGRCFCVSTNDDRHAQFVRNMFDVIPDYPSVHIDWEIIHNTLLDIDPKIYVNVDDRVMLISGTTFLGEIKKGVFGCLAFELPEDNYLPMHCAAFTYNDTTNLMFGLSGTGKTTLSSDPEYKLISDDEVYWNQYGINMIETGCYAKSEGLTPETHKTIFDAVELARERDCLVEENPGAANARLSYPITCVENAYHDKNTQFDHPQNIFFLTMDATGQFPPISKISGDVVRRFFETGYTSQMPGTEAGSNEITKTFSPCYGSPFMPRDISVYSDMLMDSIDKHDVSVYLVNTGMDSVGKRHSLEYTRKCIKTAIDLEVEDQSERVLGILEKLL